MIDEYVSRAGLVDELSHSLAVTDNELREALWRARNATEHANYGEAASAAAQVIGCSYGCGAYMRMLSMVKSMSGKRIGRG